MTNKIHRIINGFASRKYLRAKHEMEIYNIGGMLCLRIDSPVVLARFAAELRQALLSDFPSAVLLCRGQTKQTPQMRPSLFRQENEEYEVSLLCEAQDLLVQEMQRLGLKRFGRPNVPALLQHYGIKTSWLDVVDNLFVAMWFATHCYDTADESYHLIETGAEGWIYFISTEDTAGILQHVDLRCLHHHLSVRPHIQQGWSITRKSPCWKDTSRSLSEFVQATVCFKNSDAWTLNSGPISTAALFPDAIDDNTLKLLKRMAVNDILRTVEHKKHLKKGSLGYLFQPNTNKRHAQLTVTYTTH